ncbi:GvpL/GvpF family gas vesicle protein [Actinomycetospora sp. TBRC 11914]|uniref:GvpL/GvpF family gas vesicle protein n=1 Tax=Actinomycetospora sp. TBRC 11914 TaxID=2729387 RepID=UPI00145DDF6E|nr:GvpL/GvpF family gas vesicle protein [Actinomycetospora sp. TBRC 11914]NMO88592.1 GvpL/GvpF family gas vesicle protein [Actinomycetospora sp. TBRC 11914]
MSDALSYVYAVGRDLGDADLEGLAGAGVGEGDPRLVVAGGLQAVVGDVPREEFEALSLDDRLEDLGWLAATARAHHHVVDTIGSRRTIAPLSLATVYFDDDRVRTLLTDGAAAFTAVLDRLEGRAEWGVKVSMRSGGGREQPGTERPKTGAEYLRSRRQALREGDQAVARAEADAEEIDEAVRALAVASRRHRPQEQSLTGRSERMVLNGAYLVDAGAAGQLTSLVGSWSEHPRVRVELTGPWVPYSFAALEGTS